MEMPLWLCGDCSASCKAQASNESYRNRTRMARTNVAAKIDGALS